jgi:hypothetical protein
MELKNILLQAQGEKKGLKQRSEKECDRGFTVC